MLPNFLIIGTAKGATSSVYQYLREHPQVFMPLRKELHHFALSPSHSGPNWNYSGASTPSTDWDPIVTREDYESYFTDVGSAKCIGEASPVYMYYTAAAANIHAANPQMKLIACLRNPAERAFSAWLHMVRDGREKCDFRESINREAERIRSGFHAGWHYRAWGFYYRMLKPYYDHFDVSNIFVVLQEELNMAPVETMQSIYAFLDIDSDYRPSVELRFNKGGIPRYAWLHRFLTDGIHKTRLGRTIKAPFTDNSLREIVTRIKMWNLQKPSLSVADRERLIDEYRDDIMQCGELIGKDLTCWLNSQRSN